LLSPLPLSRFDEEEKPSEETKASISVEAGPLLTSASPSGSAKDAQEKTEKTKAKEATYTLKDVNEKTRVEERNLSLSNVFMDIEPEELSLSDFFPGRDREELVYVTTKLAEYFHLKTGKIDTKRAVLFRSYIGNGIMVVLDAYNAPGTGLTDFNADKVFKRQFEEAKVDVKPEFFVHKRIESKDGLAFIKELVEEHGMKPGDKLKSDQLDTFMNTISNGKSSGYTLDSLGLKCESAQLLAEYKIQDDDNFEEDDSYEQDDESDLSTESVENTLPYNYSIVLKTVPKPPLPSESSETEKKSSA
jgi:hypothetical protein